MQSETLIAFRPEGNQPWPDPWERAHLPGARWGIQRHCETTASAEGEG